MRILIVVLSDKMVHEERLAASRSFEQYSSPISMLLKARCGRFAFACTFVFPTKRFKFARIKSIDNEALLRQLVQSSQKKVPLFFTTDRLVQILDFGEVSTDRQVLSRVTRKVLSNSKHTLLPPPNIIIDTLVFRFSKSKIADLKSHNLHETSKAAALIKNKGTDTTCFVLEVCKRQGNNILCAICQV